MNVLVVSVVVAAFPAGVSALCYGAEGLANHVSYRLLTGSFRQLHVFSRDMVYAAVYLPTASAFAAVISSIGTNLLTSGGPTARVAGASLIALAMVVLPYSGFWVAKRYSRTRGVAGARKALHDARVSPPPPAELDATIARLERLHRVGVRLCEGPGRVSFVTWIRRERRTVSVLLLSLCHLVTLSFAGLAFHALATVLDSTPAALLASGMVLAAVMYYAGLLASWHAHRHTFAVLGDEFRRGTRSVLPRLYALREQVRRAADREPGPSPTVRPTVLSALFQRVSRSLR